jgi:hypothetical protein
MLCGLSAQQYQQAARQFQTHQGNPVGHQPVS